MNRREAGRRKTKIYDVNKEDKTKNNETKKPREHENTRHDKAQNIKIKAKIRVM